MKRFVKYLICSMSVVFASCSKMDVELAPWYDITYDMVEEYAIKHNTPLFINF